MTDNLVLVGGRNTSFKSVNVEELYKLPLITREDGSANKLLVEASLKEK